jgi:hypothetical protein
MSDDIGGSGRKPIGSYGCLFDYCFNCIGYTLYGIERDAREWVRKGSKGSSSGIFESTSSPVVSVLLQSAYRRTCGIRIGHFSSVNLEFHRRPDMPSAGGV